MSKNLAIITLSTQGLFLAKKIIQTIEDSDIFVHHSLECKHYLCFDRVISITPALFKNYKKLVYIMPCGVVVRAVASCLRHKLLDPAVVVLDVGARHAISLLSGHEGGANTLAVQIANILGAQPVISTTTEAVKNIIIGLGCRKGVSREIIVEAILRALSISAIDLSQVRLLASTQIKAHEFGLIQAAEQLALPLLFLPHELLAHCPYHVQRSSFVFENTGLGAVAEPAALLAGSRTSLILEKQKWKSVTVALARENCLWSE